MNEQLPEVQYYFDEGIPVRGLFFNNEAWLVAKDIIAPFGLPFEGEKTVEFIPAKWRCQIKGVSPHGTEVFLCLSEPGVKLLFDKLISMGY